MPIISTEQRDALLEKVQVLPDGAIVRVTATTYVYGQDASETAATYVTVGPLYTTGTGMRWVGETLVTLPIGGEPHLAAQAQAVEVISAAAGESA